MTPEEKVEAANHLRIEMLNLLRQLNREEIWMFAEWLHTARNLAIGMAESPDLGKNVIEEIAEGLAMNEETPS